METTSSLILAFFILLLLTTFSRRRHFKRPMNSAPSPLSLPLIGHLHLLKKPLHRSLTSLSSCYGPVLSLRFGSRPVLLVSSASAATECFSNNDITFANRPHFLAGKHLGYDYTSLVWASYGPHWRNLRLITAKEIFSSSRIDSFSKIREEEVAAMLKALANDSRKNEAVEVRSRLFELTLNVVMRMVAGKRFCIDEEEEAKQARWFLEIVEESFSVADSTNLADFLPVLRCFDYKGFERRVMKLQEKRDAFFQELVEERRTECNGNNINLDYEGGEEHSSKRRKCLIDVLLSLQTSDPEQFTDRIIKGVMTVLLLGGTETSVLTVEWALALLLTNPASLEKAVIELCSRIGNSRLINESDLPNLPYLNSIIKETLRLRPVGPIISHESAENCTVNGIEVSKGTLLLVNTWAIHRDPELWVEPEAFRPERWEGKEERGRKSGRFMAFGMGRRGCPGEGLALRVVGLTLGALLQCFDWKLGVGEELDISEGDGLSMPMATPLKAICKQREFVTEALLV